MSNVIQLLRDGAQGVLIATLAIAAFGMPVHALAAGESPAKAEPAARFLLVGSYHMDNPGQDVHNTRADDVLSEKRQREIAEVARLIERFKPTRVMVEVDIARQARLDREFAASCTGGRALGRDETEQLGFRIACARGLPGVVAVDWNGLGPMKDEASVDYRNAVERHGQQAQYEAHMAAGRAKSAADQATLEKGSVRDMLLRMNSPEWLAANARAYVRIGLLGTADDAIGANWVSLWYGRNVRIFNNIARHAAPGDRVLVIYGAGHGNFLRQLAADSGLFLVEDTSAWLDAGSPPAGAANNR